MTYGLIFFNEGVKLMHGEVCKIWRRYAPPFLRYLQKTLGGAKMPPPTGRGLTLKGQDEHQAIRGLGHGLGQGHAEMVMNRLYEANTMCFSFSAFFIL